MSSDENSSSLQAAGGAPEVPAEATAFDQKPAESGEIGDLLAGMNEVSGISPGQIVQGSVLKVTDDEVIVDIGLKSEGAIPRAEFLTDDGHLTVQRGDVVDVWVEEYDEQEGTFSVSHLKAARIRIWEELERAFREQTTVKGRVVERTKGGLMVDIGVRAFLPASQADLRPLRNLDALIGQEIVCKVIKLNKSRNNAVVSRKLALEEELNRRKAELLERLAEGVELVGRVKNLTDYGAFVDLGGMDGLLHVTDLSWGRASHPSEVVQVGQEVRVKVLKYDREKERISLGLKQLTPDPWELVASTYRPGERASGRVVSLTDYGAFVELAPGVEGLIHVSEMTWSRRLKHPSKILGVGDRVEVAVLDANPAQRRISLSLKRTLPDPWTTLADRLNVGSTVQGRVRNLTDFGAFVEIEDGVDGLIHISDLSWTRNVKHPSEVLKKGQKVEAVVLSIDPAERRISLGLKQLQPNIWEEFFSQTQVGSIVRGKILRMAQFGAFVELREGIEGLCHISEMGEDHGRSGPSPVQVGNELYFRVIRLNAVERKIGLSLRDVDQNAPELEGREGTTVVAREPQPAPTTQMAEKMAQAIRAAAQMGSEPSAPEATAAPPSTQPRASENSEARVEESATTSASEGPAALDTVQAGADERLGSIRVAAEAVLAAGGEAGSNRVSTVSRAEPASSGAATLGEPLPASKSGS